MKKGSWVLRPLNMAQFLRSMKRNGGPFRTRSPFSLVLGAVAESGFRSELWSYEFRGGRPAAVRYGTAGDIQLWSTSDLAVQYALARLPR